MIEASRLGKDYISTVVDPAELEDSEAAFKLAFVVMHGWVMVGYGHVIRFLYAMRVDSVAA